MSLVSCVEVCRAMTQAPAAGPPYGVSTVCSDSLLSSPTTHRTTITPPAFLASYFFPITTPASLPNNFFLPLFSLKRDNKGKVIQVISEGCFKTAQRSWEPTVQRGSRDQSSKTRSAQEGAKSN